MKKFFRIFLFISLFGLITGPLLAEENKDSHRAVELDWEPVEGATGYELRVTRVLGNGKKKDPFIFKVDKAAWNGSINPGKYQLQLRSFDDRGVPGEWSDSSEFWVKVPPPKATFPEHEAQVITAEDDDYEIKLKWSDVSDAGKYQIEIESDDKAVNKTINTIGKFLEVTLPVSKKYYWRVTAIMGGGATGETPEEWDEFVLLGSPLDKPDIEKPISKFVTQLEWEKPKRAKSYHYQIYRKKKGRWKLTEENKKFTSNKVPFDLSRPPGKYRAQVQAFAPFTQNSKVSQIQFRAAGNLRTPAAVEGAILKDSIEKPSRWYGIASYFITQMNYVGQEHNSSAGINGEVSPLGGTGRLGLGYQKPRRKYGYFGVLDLSGFNIGADNYNFASMELHATYEPWKKKSGNSSQAKFTAGLFMKELPLLVPDSNKTFNDVSTITQRGVHGGFRYWQPLNQKYGYQLNARLYYNLMGEVQGGSSFESTMGFQAGILGSYRLSKKIMGLAGYAYRVDEARFTPDSCGGAACPSGTQSFVEITGHYLNLILEVSF